MAQEVNHTEIRDYKSRLEERLRHVPPAAGAYAILTDNNMYLYQVEYDAQREFPHCATIMRTIIYNPREFVSEMEKLVRLDHVSALAAPGTKALKRLEEIGEFFDEKADPYRGMSERPHKYKMTVDGKTKILHYLLI